MTADVVTNVATDVVDDVAVVTADVVDDVAVVTAVGSNAATGIVRV